MVERNGEDLHIFALDGGPVRATCFGGADDPQDSGETASGISTRANPDLQACSLPMRHDSIKALQGSPLPKMPWLTKVEVKMWHPDAGPSDGLVYRFPVIDLGPGRRTGNAIDLTIAAAQKFKPEATARNFEMKCWVRIIGGAKYL